MRWVTVDDREIRFWGDTVVGRGHAGIVIDHRTVSAQHARISHFDGAWHIRDLGSKNGTFVDGQRVEVGPWRRLEAGARIDLGGAPSFRVADLRPPTMHARNEGGVIALPVDGVLALPSSDAPEILVMQGMEGHVIERDGLTTPVADGAEVTAGGELWRIFIGRSDADLLETQPTMPARDLRSTRLVFTEAVEASLVRLCVAADDGQVAISGRPFIVVLLHLARARLEDRDQAIDERECGWRSRRDILGSLRITPEKLNLDLHRARRVLSAEGVHGVDTLIERRRERGMLRIGPSHLTIHPPVDVEEPESS
jgi:pSer/pThr/pTyr-binding forkhead associated (FHA) protein